MSKRKPHAEDDGEVRKRHDYEPKTQYCMRCGLHHEMIDTEDYLCVGGENVIAISHLRALRRLEEASAPARK